MLTKKQKIERAVISVLKVLPVKENRISFLCYNCTQYSCNPKYITEYLHRTYGDKYELIWFYTDENVRKLFPSYVKAYRKNSPAYFCSLLTSRFVISNVTLPRVVDFRKEQICINTWHGTAFKGDSNSHGNDYNRFNYFLAENELTAGVLRRPDSFAYTGEIEKTGMPRNDCLIRGDSERAAKVRETLGIRQDEKILLYAPTFRDTEGEDAFEIDFRALQQSLVDRFGGEWRILLRFHHMQKGRPSAEHAVDVTSYPDMQELLLASDILITDYSSSMWDFSLMQKPVFLFSGDLEHYIKEERGDFYYPYSRLPFPTAADSRELCSRIAQFEEEAYLSAVSEYHRELGRFNICGDATEKFVKKFLKS
ncbi:MAG: CDP-glycerol glycerophosphotransferase family protein [Lachnospiraceae bacterium]|nr:CDP-glycerol glycerophosphotransferase family protein [Lachnospiraceae bacterium]